ncbi:MAG TPA: ion channel [Stellaceae bacterium]|jgi:inward rectifier potassium channel|nr:ion channel [Stellaceae bacterium]
MAKAKTPAKRPPRQRRARTTVRATTMGGPGGIRLISDGARGWPDVYHRLFTMSWPVFFGLFATVYVFFNLIFAAIYLADLPGIANARPGSFADAFFFSVQTMATVGFGDMHPRDLFANIVVTIEVLLGLTTIACATALIFSRFSRATARVMFSEIAVIAPYDGVPTLMFRAANRRRNQILEAQVSVSVLRDEVTVEGKEMRRFHDLALARARTPIFSLSWTVMHPIEASSVLHGATPESLARQDARLIITMTGIDETFSSTIHARHIYPASAIVWNHRFVDILGESADGVPTLDYRRFNQVEPG